MDNEDSLRELASRVLEQYDPSHPRIRYVVPDIPDANDMGVYEELFAITSSEIISFVQAVNSIITEHEDLEYRTWIRENDGSISSLKIILGTPCEVLIPQGFDDDESQRRSRIADGRITLDDLPLADKWREMAVKLVITPKFLLVYNRLPHIIPAARIAPPLESFLPPYIGWLSSIPWFRYLIEVENEARSSIKKECVYESKKGTVAYYLEKEYPDAVLYPILRQMVLSLMNVPAPDSVNTSGYNSILWWIADLGEKANEDEHFVDYFHLFYEWAFGDNTKKWEHRIFKNKDIIRAYKLGIAPKNDLIRIMNVVRENKNVFLADKEVWELLQ